MKSTLREEQRSIAETKMRRETGQTFVANAIWKIGLPRLPSFATEQRNQRLTPAALEAVPEAILTVLCWLDRLASAEVEKRSKPQRFRQSWFPPVRSFCYRARDARATSPSKT